MEFKKIYLTVSVIALTCSQYAVASPLNNTSHTHTQHTLELKPISNSFQLAAAVFLPDKGEDYGFNGRELNDNHGNTTPNLDLCTKFPLSSCPANAKCSKCISGNKFKLNGCNDGYKLSSGTCLALTCSEINSAYRADVPVNQVCSTVSTYGKTCYQTCKTIDFSGYPITSCPANATCTDHPDCATTSTKKGNCSPIKKKVTTCTLPSQKLNANASGCVNKDDTCPTTYFKTCETGTTGTTKYTELGTACYQCKLATPPVNAGDILFSDKTTGEDLIPGKTPIGVVFNPRRRLAIALKTEVKIWSTTYFDVPGLTNYNNYDTVSQDWAGRANTTTVINYCKSNNYSCPALEYVNSYTTAGTKTGDWYLPSLGEVEDIYLNRSLLDRSLYKIGYPTSNPLNDMKYGLLSSSVYDNSRAWMLSSGNGNITYICGYTVKINPITYVRPVTAF